MLDKRYYKNEYRKPAKSEKKAKLVEIIIQESDGSFRYELRDIKTNNLIQLTLFKDNVPVGNWLFAEGYELVYNNQEYEGILRYDIVDNSVKGSFSGEFEAPVFQHNDYDFRKFIDTNLLYPYNAAVEGIQGTVICQFILDETGKVNYFSILKSANPELDKEVARLILKSPLWIPAKLDGKPIKVHIIMPTNFILQ